VSTSAQYIRRRHSASAELRERLGRLTIKQKGEEMSFTVSASDQRLQYVADPSAQRYSRMAGVEFNGALACATNGRVLAIKSKDEATTAEQINLQFTSPKQTGCRLGHEVYIEAGERCVGKTNPRNVATPRTDGRFPRLVCEDLVPSGDPVVTVSFDAAALLDLAMALCDGDQRYVTLQIYGPKQALIVIPDEGIGAGLLMPVTADDPDSVHQAKPRERLIALLSQWSNCAPLGPVEAAVAADVITHHGSVVERTEGTDTSDETSADDYEDLAWLDRALAQSLGALPEA
jgi:hypothetical protein